MRLIARPIANYYDAKCVIKIEIIGLKNMFSVLTESVNCWVAEQFATAPRAVSSEPYQLLFLVFSPIFSVFGSL